LTNHAQVLVCVARAPGLRLRDIGKRLPDPIAREQNVEELPAILRGGPATHRRVARWQTRG
jgi:hypothetical protein